MNKSDIQETLVSLYLRLNGYFVSGFIAHAPTGTRTEMDVLAVRFPQHQEPEREVEPCNHLAISGEGPDFIIGEVKGGKNVTFNTKFWRSPEAIESVLRRIGAFDEEEIERIREAVPHLLDPDRMNHPAVFPTLNVELDGNLKRSRGTVRFLLFAPEQNRTTGRVRPFIFGDDMLSYIWTCFRPEHQRAQCGVRYNFELWGPQYTTMVRYFKDKDRTTCGEIDGLYAANGLESEPA